MGFLSSILEGAGDLWSGSDSAGSTMSTLGSGGYWSGSPENGEWVLGDTPEELMRKNQATSDAFQNRGVSPDGWGWRGEYLAGDNRDGTGGTQYAPNDVIREAGSSGGFFTDRGSHQVSGTYNPTTGQVENQQFEAAGGWSVLDLAKMAAAAYGGTMLQGAEVGAAGAAEAGYTGAAATGSGAGAGTGYVGAGSAGAGAVGTGVAGAGAGAGLAELGAGTIEGAGAGAGPALGTTESLGAEALAPNMAATNPALIESGTGQTGYGPSSAGAGGGLDVGQELANLGSALWRGLSNTYTGPNAFRNALSTYSGVQGLSRAREQRRNARRLEATRAGYASQLAELERNPNSLTTRPGYQAGLIAVQRRAAAGGYLGSGNEIASLAEYGGNEFAREASRLSQGAGIGWDPSTGLNRAAELEGQALASLGYAGGGVGRQPRFDPFTGRPLGG